MTKTEIPPHTDPAVIASYARRGSECAYANLKLMTRVLNTLYDEALRIDERHTLDLTETARQYLLTALPLQSVCSPSCKGLCPNCGANLNLGPCGCDEELPTNPFALLTSILPAQSSGDGTPGT
jgi:uncharacterized metal-binding protein YceD (DUF177 family)